MARGYGSDVFKDVRKKAIALAESYGLEEGDYIGRLDKDVVQIIEDVDLGLDPDKPPLIHKLPKEELLLQQKRKIQRGVQHVLTSSRRNVIRYSRTPWNYHFDAHFRTQFSRLAVIDKKRRLSKSDKVLRTDVREILDQIIPDGVEVVLRVVSRWIDTVSPDAIRTEYVQVLHVKGALEGILHVRETFKTDRLSTLYHMAYETMLLAKHVHRKVMWMQDDERKMIESIAPLVRKVIRILKKDPQPPPKDLFSWRVDNMIDDFLSTNPLVFSIPDEDD